MEIIMIINNINNMFNLNDHKNSLSADMWRFIL